MSEIIAKSLKTAVKGTVLVMSGTVASMVFWFATKVLIVRNTTKEEFGIYSLVVAILGICSLLSTLGLQDGISRYISVFLGEGKKIRADAMAWDAISLGMFFVLTHT